MNDIEIHHLGAAYALDALDERERIAFEAHFSSCEICQTDVWEYRAAAAELGTLTSQDPPLGLKAAVMGDIATTRQLSPLPGDVTRLVRRRSPVVTALLAAAAAIVLFVGGALVVVARDGGDVGDEFAAIATAPDGRVARLSGDGAGSVTVAWGGGRVAVVANGLDVATTGLAYEVWLIDAAGAHPLRMLDDADDGTIERVFDIAAEPLAWGITLEPDAGSNVPTEPILFAADVTDVTA